MVGKYMMATRASGDPRNPRAMDLSRNKPDLMRVDGEDGAYWVGHWVEGFGFVDVYFPKATARPCTPAEKTEIMGYSLSIPNMGLSKFLEEDFA